MSKHHKAKHKKDYPGKSWTGFIARLVLVLIFLFTGHWSYVQTKEIMEIVERRHRTEHFLATANRGDIVPEDINTRILWKNGNAMGLQVVGCEYIGYHRGWSAYMIVVNRRMWAIWGWR